MIKLAIGYPTVDEEQEILRRRRERRQEAVELQQVTTAETLLEMRAAVENVYVEPDLERYLVRIAAATRTDNRVAVGASPRGSLALLKLSRARAALQGRAYILPDDIKHFAEPALAHRLILVPELWMRRGADNRVIAGVLEAVSIPVFEGLVP
jgi:MoxR-like ATPase